MAAHMMSAAANDDIQLVATNKHTWYRVKEMLCSQSVM
jgi:hypothetical protein